MRTRTINAFLIVLWISVCGDKLTVSGLDVEVPPIYVTYELGVINVTCRVVNYGPEVTYTWTRPDDDDFLVDGALLYLQEVTTDEAGTYVCSAVAVSDSSLTGEGTMEVDVQYSPRWAPYVINKFGCKVGEVEEIRCEIRCNPPSEFYWQYGGSNITSDSRRRITSSGDVSTVMFDRLQSSDYGDYRCFASNTIGAASFQVRLLEPGPPDGPQSCYLGETYHDSIVLVCVPGYDGGEELSFNVYARDTWSDDWRAESTEEWNDNGLVNITVTGLYPNVNYTLTVFGSNMHGESDFGTGVYVRTEDGERPPSSTFPTEMVIIICGVVGGVILAVIIIAIVVVCVRRRKPDKSLPRFENKKDSDTYITEDQDNISNLCRENSHRSSFKRKNSWGSFKRTKPVKVSGENNPGYQGDYSPTRRHQPRPADYITTSPKSTQLLNSSRDPGDSSDIGYHDNAGYHPSSDSVEINFGDPSNPSASYTSPEVKYRRQPNTAAMRAHKLSQDQPSLAGHGALSFNPMGPVGNATPVLNPLRRHSSRMSTFSGDSHLSLEVEPSPFQPDVPWEFPWEKLYIRHRLGEGSFGEVWRAKADGILGRDGQQQIVAVKLLKENHTPEEKRALHKELEVMKLLQPHPNIIQLLGCCTQKPPLCIVMEFAANGNLQDMLRKQRTAFEMNNLNIAKDEPQRNINLTVRDLHIFALHVASGMEYIASRELLHRDLAARNTLVDEKMICKICDFGSARDIAEMRQYESKTQRRLPLRWMAPESLFQCVYTTETDVWAFGVVLWEIITLGSSPFPGMSGPEVMQFVQKGCRMSKPKHCSDALYAIMKDCWHQFPTKRPAFSIIRHRLAAILDEPSNSMFVDQMSENIYQIMENQPGEKF